MRATIEQLIERLRSARCRRARWPNWVLGNHDKPRLASRVGREQARVAAMLLLTLRGTPTLYYGDEIGMGAGADPARACARSFEKNVPGIGVGRDGCRTPMQWDAGKHAGFSTARPWLPLAKDAVRECRILDADAKSILSLYRMLIALRRKWRALAAATTCPSRPRVICWSSQEQREQRRDGRVQSRHGARVGRDQRRDIAVDVHGPAGREDRRPAALRGNEGVIVAHIVASSGPSEALLRAP